MMDTLSIIIGSGILAILYGYVVGKQISVPFLHLNDNCHHISNIAAATFDRDGRPTKKINIITQI